MPEDITIIATEKSSGYPEFSPPSGFMPPEGVEPGKPFPALVELQVKPDGQLCLVSIEGSEYPKEGEEEYEEEMEMEEEVLPMDLTKDERGLGERLADLPMV